MAVLVLPGLVVRHHFGSSKLPLDNMPQQTVIGQTVIELHMPMRVWCSHGSCFGVRKLKGGRGGRRRRTGGLGADREAHGKGVWGWQQEVLIGAVHRR